VEWPRAAHGLRAFAVGDEFAGGVVDGGDVVSIEGVAGAQGVGGDAQAEAEGLGTDPEVVGYHQGGQDAEGQDVQDGDDREQAPGAPSI